jgi:hypothetical protein
VRYRLAEAEPELPRADPGRGRGSRQDMTSWAAGWASRSGRALAPDELRAIL